MLSAHSEASWERALLGLGWCEAHYSHFLGLCVIRRWLWNSIASCSRVTLFGLQLISLCKERENEFLSKLGYPFDYL